MDVLGTISPTGKGIAYGGRISWDFSNPNFPAVQGTY